MMRLVYAALCAVVVVGYQPLLAAGNSGGAGSSGTHGKSGTAGSGGSSNSSNGSSGQAGGGQTHGPAKAGDNPNRCDKGTNAKCVCVEAANNQARSDRMSYLGDKQSIFKAIDANVALNPKEKADQKKAIAQMFADNMKRVAAAHVAAIKACGGGVPAGTTDVGGTSDGGTSGSGSGTGTGTTPQ